VIDTKYLRGSDGTGSAVLAHVSVNRLAGATTLKVDNVDNWPPFFIATSGKLNPAGYIIESTKKEFRGHLQGVDIIIDGFEPGFTDEGNTTDQVVILKQTTGWANRAQDALEELQGVVQTDLPRQFSESSADFVVSGGIWSLISGRDATMTALVAYIKGYRNTIAAVATRTFTASKDTYVDVLKNPTTNIFTLVYSEVANGAASPSLAANSIRLAKVITSGTAITFIVQSGFDSLGNRLRNTGVIGGAQAPSLFYEELTRMTVITPVNELFSGTFPARRYLQIRGTLKLGGVTRVAMQFNGDSGVNYSDDYSLYDGNATGLDISQTFMPIYGRNSGAGDVIHFVLELDNYATFHKLGRVDSYLAGQPSNGGGLPQTCWTKWINQVNQITSARLFNRDAATFVVGSEVIVLGHD